MAKVKINQRKITAPIEAALNDAALIMQREIIQVISDPNAFEGFPNQDIVDTGNLRANQQPPEVTGATATFRNTAEYAIYVYLGYTLRNGRTQEGRPWMALGLERGDFFGTFAKLLKAKLA